MQCEVRHGASRYVCFCRHPAPRAGACHGLLAHDILTHPVPSHDHPSPSCHYVIRCRHLVGFSSGQRHADSFWTVAFDLMRCASIAVTWPTLIGTRGGAAAERRGLTFSDWGAGTFKDCRLIYFKTVGAILQGTLLQARQPVLDTAWKTETVLEGSTLGQRARARLPRSARRARPGHLTMIDDTGALLLYPSLAFLIARECALSVHRWRRLTQRKKMWKRMHC